MVQSVSTSGNIAAALMAATQARKETEEKLRQQAAAEVMSLAAKDRDDDDEVERELDKFATSPVRPTNAAKPPKRGPTQREIRDRQYEGGIEAERERQFQAREDAAGRNAEAKAKIKKRNEENRVDTRTSRGGGRSAELGYALEVAREEGGQAAVDDLLSRYFPEYAEQQASGMATNPTQAERKADMRRDANRRANQARDFRETFGQDASSIRRRYGDQGPGLMARRLNLSNARGGTPNPGELMPEGFHRLRPDVQSLRVQRGLEEGRVTDAEMEGLLNYGGDVREFTGKAENAMRGSLGRETSFEEIQRLAELGRQAEMKRAFDAGGAITGNTNQQGVGLPGDAATRMGTLYRGNVIGSAAQGFGDYFQDPIGTTIDFYDRNIVSPARDRVVDVLDRLLPR